MAIRTLAIKDLRVLFRDTRALIILIAMPLIFILVLGMALGESFGQKPDSRLRVSVVNLDAGLPSYPPNSYPAQPWAEIILDDLATTSGIRVELIPDRATAERLVRRAERSAVLVLGPNFSRQVSRCSFLAERTPEPLNPFFRDGVNFSELDVEVLIDPTQATAAAIMEQVAQVTMLRVILPWMIGQAFEHIGDPDFMVILGREMPIMQTAYRLVKPAIIGESLKKGISKMFAKYDLTAKTWAQLTRQEPRPQRESTLSTFQDAPPAGMLNRGSTRYQILVPSYTVMFAFFLVLSGGWLFVAERRQGTMLRLRAAPIQRWQILLGKWIPCFLLSLFQGFLLLLAGRGIFGMNWGPQPLWLIAIVVTTSLAATGLAMLVASLARTETQVAIYGTLLVLVLAGLSGCLMPRDLMPEEMRQISLVTPHAWALDAYSQLLLNPQPEYGIVMQACLMLAAFGGIYLTLAWARLRLD